MPHAHHCRLLGHDEWLHRATAAASSLCLTRPTPSATHQPELTTTSCRDKGGPMRSLPGGAQNCATQGTTAACRWASPPAPLLGTLPAANCLDGATVAHCFVLTIACCWAIGGCCSGPAWRWRGCSDPNRVSPPTVEGTVWNGDDGSCLETSGPSLATAV